MTPKVEKPPPFQGKVKKVNPKSKQKKELNLPSTNDTVTMPKETLAPSLPSPIDAPASDNDDNFWDFYDKPFNKPT